MQDRKDSDGEPTNGSAAGKATKEQGWSGVLADEDLGGAPDDKMEVVQNASDYDAVATYKYKPSALDMGRKQDFDGEKLGLPKPGSEAAAGDAKLQLPKPGTGTKSVGDAKAPGMGLPAAIPQGLFVQPSAAYRPKKSKAPLVFVVLVALGGGGYAFYAKREKAPPPTPIGSIMVSSMPKGAKILVDGKETAHTTPFEVPNIVANIPTKISVSMPGFQTFPSESSVSVPENGAVVPVSFTLQQTIVMEIVTDPPGADVFVDGKALPGLTPRKLPPFVAGSNITLEIDKDGYMREKVMLTIAAEGPASRTVTLMKATTIEVASDPAGAEVKIDGQRFGETPIYELKIPENAKFELRIEKEGFKPYVKKVQGKALGRKVDVKLEQLSLLALPMSNEDKAEAQRLDRAVHAARAAFQQARQRFDAVEQQHRKVTSDPKSMFGDRARAEKAMDEASANLERREAAYNEAQMALDEFRAQATSRADGTP